MSYQIIFRGERPENPQVGDAYYARGEHCGVWGPGPHEGVPYAYAHDLTRQFEQAGRRPIMVVLPCGYHFCIDSAYWSSSDTNPDRSGWDVRILAPPEVDHPLLLTLSPSVNIVGSYHGWIGINSVPPGFISDDLDARVYKK